MMAARRAAVSIIAAGAFAAFAFSLASMRVPQPLIAETASDHSSKSVLSTPGLATFIRNRVGIVQYALFEARS
jgi:hypothetical protein